MQDKPAYLAFAGVARERQSDDGRNHVWCAPKTSAAPARPSNGTPAVSWIDGPSTDPSRRARPRPAGRTGVSASARVLPVQSSQPELVEAPPKALSDEETQAIVEGIEDTKAEVEEARRVEAEQRRAAAREEREQAENVRQTAESAAETMATTVAFPVHLARRTAETARENVKSSLNTAAQGFQSLTEQFANLTGLREAEELARRSFENLQAVSDSSSVLARGIQEASQLWIALAQERLTKNFEGISRFARCRSPQDFIAMQSEFARDAMQQAVETSRRVGQVSIRVADEAAGVIQARASAKPDRVRQAA